MPEVEVTEEAVKAENIEAAESVPATVPIEIHTLECLSARRNKSYAWARKEAMSWVGEGPIEKDGLVWYYGVGRWLGFKPGFIPQFVYPPDEEVGHG